MPENYKQIHVNNGNTENQPFIPKKNKWKSKIFKIRAYSKSIKNILRATK